MNVQQSNQRTQEQLNVAFRSPKRITITVPYGAYQRLQARSDQEGRSMSNLAAYILESAIDGQIDTKGRVHQ